MNKINNKEGYIKTTERVEKRRERRWNEKLLKAKDKYKESVWNN